MKTTFQVSDHGAGKFSVQVFDENGQLIDDRAIVRDVNGWQVIGDQKYSDLQHDTVAAAAQHYAFLVHHARPTNA